MKKLVFLLLLVPMWVSGQPKELPFPRDENGKVKHTEVVKVDSTVLAKTLYGNAKFWIGTAFKSAKAVIQLEDESNGRLVGTGIITYFPKGAMMASDEKLELTFSIQCKDGRYKYELYNMIMKFRSPNNENWDWKIEDYFNEKQWYKNNGKIREAKIPYKEGIEKSLNDFIAEMKKAMLANSKGKDDW